MQFNQYYKFEEPDFDTMALQPMEFMKLLAMEDDLEKIDTLSRASHDRYQDAGFVDALSWARAALRLVAKYPETANEQWAGYLERLVDAHNSRVRRRRR